MQVEIIKELPEDKKIQCTDVDLWLIFVEGLTSLIHLMWFRLRNKNLGLNLWIVQCTIWCLNIEGNHTKVTSYMLFHCVLLSIVQTTFTLNNTRMPGKYISRSYYVLDSVFLSHFLFTWPSLDHFYLLILCLRPYTKKLRLNRIYYVWLWWDGIMLLSYVPHYGPYCFCSARILSTILL